MIELQRFLDNAARCGVPVDRQQAELLDRYAALLVETNEKINLTAITDPEGIENKHFIDSLLLASQPEVSGSLVDVGTGAGFPGVVAKIYRPALDLTLRKHEIVDFIEGLRAQDEKAARWSAATANKIRQVLTACLEQCGMYDRKTEQLAPLLLDFDLEHDIRANGDADILPAFGITE